ncbi:MAG: DUF4252 domain-containing protein [Bacteroides sp.]|nr:DUF4252 domain-containing protein [Bacteroides sp.]
MKKFILTLLLTLFSSLGALAQTKLYEACRSDSQFECVFIGKAMLRMVNSHKLHVKGMDLNTVIEKLESIEVISTEKAKASTKLNEMITKEFAPEKKYEIMMEAKDEEDTVTIYCRKLNDKTNEYVLVNAYTGDHETTVIILTGSITPEDLKNLRRL